MSLFSIGLVCIIMLVWVCVKIRVHYKSYWQVKQSNINKGLDVLNGAMSGKVNNNKGGNIYKMNRKAINDNRQLMDRFEVRFVYPVCLLGLYSLLGEFIT